MRIEQISAQVVRCRRCPQLRVYCRQVATQKKRAFADWNYWGKPVPAFGDSAARLMLIGLAPGAHGSNRTGRMFTGDASGDFLYPALFRAGFATQPQAFGVDDNLRLRDCIITSAARCAPPKNRPTPQELRNCFPYLVAEFDALPKLEVVVGLGLIGWEAAVKMLREHRFAFDPPRPRFGHGEETTASNASRTITLIGSFHPSRQNTNTGKLDAAMFDAVFARASIILGTR